MSPFLRTGLLVGVLSTVLVIVGQAADYNSEFGAPSSNPAQTVDSGRAGTYRTWRSVGEQRGVNIRNTSGRTIVGIHIRTLREADRFVLPATFDSFFLKVWLKKDGREVIYNGGNIPRGSEFYTKVSRTNDFPRKILDGKLSDTDFPIDNPEEWDLVHDGTKGLSESWNEFLPACPSHLRQIELYARNDAGAICFVSSQRLYMYLPSSGHVYSVVLHEALPARINSIAVSAAVPGEFTVFHNAVELGQVPAVTTRGKEGDVIVFRHAKQSGDGDVDNHVGDCDQPVATISYKKRSVSVNRAYFVRQKLFNLRERVFTQVFFDDPKALAVIDQATPLGEDDCFYYFQVTTFGTDVEWAFSVQPAGRFSGHTIWSRRAGDTEWTKEDGEVVMADIRTASRETPANR